MLQKIGTLKKILKVRFKLNEKKNLVKSHMLIFLPEYINSENAWFPLLG